MGVIGSAGLVQALATLGELLQARGLHYRLVVVGGGALLLQGLTQRSTADLDVVGQIAGSGIAKLDPFPDELRDAVADVARTMDLAPDWLDARPMDLLEFGLPEGFLERTEARRYSALEIHTASRIDQIHLKLYAAVDRGPTSKHFADLTALQPNRRELLMAARWAQTHDPSAPFRGELLAALRALGLEISDDEL